jgi:hypothetical protein
VKKGDIVVIVKPFWKVDYGDIGKTGIISLIHTIGNSTTYIVDIDEEHRAGVLAEEVVPASSLVKELM